MDTLKAVQAGNALVAQDVQDQRVDGPRNAQAHNEVGKDILPAAVCTYFFPWEMCFKSNR
ncbi:MAG: hypothetical protein JSV42_01075 [Chloroflexota bacterium]|nr:MAG: hypothetical protein JSV42_01075 [Chloroflexota bacterium]